MSPKQLRFIKNAFSNIVNGGSGALLAIVLPYFFVRYFSQAEFSIWVLVLQLGAYVNYLNFGIQVAIGRYVAHSLERGDRAHAEKVVAAGIQILFSLGIIGFGIILVVVWQFPHFFAQVPASMVPTARAALLWVGGALALGLPFSAFFGVFIGLQRNDIPAMLAIASKTFLAFVLVVAAERTKDLVFVAQAYFWGNLLTYLVRYPVFRAVCSGWRLPLFGRNIPELKELASYCVSLSAWTLAMLLVSGLDTTIVGVFDFHAVAAYGVATGIVSFFAGSLQALFAPLIQEFAKYHARDEIDRAVALMYRTMFLCSLFLLISAGWMCALARPGFALWVGAELGGQAVPLFFLLIAANTIRCSAIPYADYLVATGQQRRVIISPLLEGGVNLVVSVIGAYYLGAIGVAIGTLVGAIVGLLAHYIYNIARTLPRKNPWRAVACVNAMKPALFALPLLPGLAAILSGLAAEWLDWSLMVAGSVPALWALLSWRSHLIWDTYFEHCSAPLKTGDK